MTLGGAGGGGTPRARAGGATPGGGAEGGVTFGGGLGIPELVLMGGEGMLDHPAFWASPSPL
jgi:hypothetical protein